MTVNININFNGVGSPTVSGLGDRSLAWEEPEEDFDLGYSLKYPLLPGFTSTETLLSRAKGKGKKKSKKCEKGQVCGLSCIAKTKTCIANMTTAQLMEHNKSKRAEKKAKAQAKKAAAGGASGTETPSANTTEQIPTLKVREYNPNAIKDLSLNEFREYWYKAKPSLEYQDDSTQIHNIPYTKEMGTKASYMSKLNNSIMNIGNVPSDEVLASVKLSNKQLAKVEENRERIAKMREQSERIERAINHPVVTPEEAANHKTQMSREEAESYVKDSYMGNLSIWHGNPASVVDSIANDGADPEKNNNGFYGKGTYFGLEREVGEYYAGAAGMTARTELGNNNEVGVIEGKVNIKNPYIITSQEYNETINKAFPGDQMNAVDSAAVTAYVRARGYDSIYVSDLGYVVTGAKEQVVIVDNKKINVYSEDFAKIDIMKNQKPNGMLDDIARYEATPIAKALNKKKATDSPDFLQFNEFEDDF